MKLKINILMSFSLITLSVFSQTSVNALNRFSKSNVMAINTEGNSENWDVYGSYFQFGRNIAIPSSGTVPTASTATNASDPVVVSDVFILGTSGNWFSNNSMANDTWKGIVNDKTNSTLTTYNGVNDGDPCPVGYHVPTVSEMKAVFPVAGVKYNATGDAIDKAETFIDIDGSGVNANYTSDFKNINTTTTVALRFKGTIHATAFKYEWVSLSGLKISAKNDAVSTITQIADPNYDWTGAVVRYFPAAGMRGQGDGLASTKGGTGYYLTSNASSTANAFVANIKSDVVITTNFPKAHAFCIRCIKNFVDTPTSDTSGAFYNSINVYTNEGYIFIENNDYADSFPYTIYNVTGRIISQGLIASEKEIINLQLKGVFVVKVGNKGYKVVL